MEDSAMMDASQPIFEELHFTIIPNTITEERQQQLAGDIVRNGGTIHPFDASHGRIENLKEITHIISATSDFPDYYDALDLFIHVVKPSWVDACLKLGKLKNPRTYSPDPALYMNDVVICCGNLPEGDKEAIAGGVLATGGLTAVALTKQVTHLVALSMDDPRCQLAMEKRLHCLYVLPHWFDDCLRVGRRISERPYILPDPEILDVTAGAIPPSRTSPQIRDATNPDPVKNGSPPTPPPRLEPSRAIKAFEKKKVKLGEDLDLTDNLKDVISGLISAGGGEVTSNIDQADVYICNYRDGQDYVKASQAKKDVGNLSWLYYLITHDVWTNPMRRMMHYPRPRDGVPGFKGYRISISSYTGEARVYLENLIKASGAEFTKTFKQDNTHLITAHKQSEKCEAAHEWGVNVINHLWLEDSYSKCQEQPLTDNKYTHFPSRTNLGEILGHTEIDRDAVEKMFFSKTRKPKSLKAAAVQQDSVPGSSLPKAKVTNDQGAHSSPLVEQNRRIRTVGDVATPLAKRRTDGKENETPIVPGSRGAKDRANAKLHESAADVAKFEKEMKRKGGVIHGGRRDKDAEVEEKLKKSKGRDSTASKRSIDEVEAVEEPSGDEEATEEPGQKNKRAKKDKLTPIKYRMLLTKDERWANNPDKESKDKAKMRELGLFITDDSKKVDLLCAPKVVRTKKFVSALACGPTLVSSAYLDFALKNNKLPAPEKFPLTDQDFVKTHNIHLEEAIPRARQNQKRLLKGWTIYCTENLTGGSDTYKDIIEANGGKCQIWKGKGIATATASKRKIDKSDEVSQNLQEDEGDVLYLISEANKKEFGNWAKFRELAEKHDMIPRIVKTEWILHVAMAQYVHCKKEWELSEEVVNVIKK